MTYFRISVSPSVSEGHITETDLRNHFYQYGEIRSLTLVTARGCAFIVFTERESAEMAAEAVFNKVCMYYCSGTINNTYVRVLRNSQAPCVSQERISELCTYALRFFCISLPDCHLITIISSIIANLYTVAFIPITLELASVLASLILRISVYIFSLISKNTFSKRTLGFYKFCVFKDAVQNSVI